MNKTAVFTGIALTAAAGTAAYVMNSKKMKSQRKKIKKNTDKAIKLASEFVDNVSYLLK